MSRLRARSAWLPAAIVGGLLATMLVIAGCGGGNNNSTTEALKSVGAGEGKLKPYPYDKSGSPESYEYRLRSVREQTAALNLLSASMTPAQQERLRTQTLREFMIFDGNAATTVVSPPEK